MTRITEKPEIDALADADLFYVRDASDPTNPDKKVPYSKIRTPVVGVKMTHQYRYAGDINVPAMAAGAELSATIAVAGAAVGDHVVFNMAPPANIAILGCWVSGADTVSVKFRNTHASNAFIVTAVACVALVSRTS